MKRIFITLFAISLMAVGACAQGRLSYTVKSHSKWLAGTWTGGVKVGMNLANFWGGDLPHGFRNGGQVGVFAEFRPSKPEWSRWSFAPELVFSSQGGRFSINKALSHLSSEKLQLTGAMSALNMNLIVTTNYINLPLMVKYRVTPHLSVEAGPQVGFNVYSHVHVDNYDSISVNLRSRTHKVDVGLGAGATYYLTDYIMFNVRYNMDFIRTFNDVDDHNGNLQFAVGYRF